VKAFGVQTLDVLDTNPEKLVSVAKIGKHRAKLVGQGWKDQKSIQEVMLFLQEHEVSTTHAVKIYKRYGEKAIQILQENPYRLAMDIYGIGFKTADEIAFKLGIGKEDSKRLRAGLLQVLYDASDSGHCYLERSELLELANRYLELQDPNLLFSPLDEMVLSKHIVAEGDRTFLPNLYQSEVEVSKKVLSLLQNPVVVDEERVRNWITRFQEKESLMLSSEQVDSVVKAAQSRVFILTGGPGTGKTTTTRTVVRLFKAMGRDVALASPTGRASQRLSEVVGLEAKTVHRLLEFDPSVRGFRKGKEDPIEAEVLVLDEASMLDLPLFHSVLNALSEKAQLILVGDSDQLPSVGPGNVLSDLIQSGVVPKVHLSQIFRQAGESQIVQGAHEINRGEFPAIMAPGEGKSDFYFMEAEEPEEVVSLILKFVSEWIPKHFHFSPREEIQILSPMNRGLIGNEKINFLLQEALNPQNGEKEEVQRFDGVFREGDRVIQKVNNYDLNVFNGDLGILKKIDPENQVCLIQYGDREVSYDYSDLNEVGLAYSISIHKSQGSEFPAVVIPIHTQHYVMLSRNLIYTGITRGKKLVILVGTSKALRMALNRKGHQERNTGLRERLKALL